MAKKEVGKWYQWKPEVGLPHSIFKILDIKQVDGKKLVATFDINFKTGEMYMHTISAAYTFVADREIIKLKMPFPNRLKHKTIIFIFGKH